MGSLKSSRTVAEEIFFNAEGTEGAEERGPGSVSSATSVLKDQALRFHAAMNMPLALSSCGQRWSCGP